MLINVITAVTQGGGLYQDLVKRIPFLQPSAIDKHIVVHYGSFVIILWNPSSAAIVASRAA